jgi:xylulokinase
MSLLGIDVGTTGCKAAVFSESGMLLSSAYREYNIKVERPGWAELDSRVVWNLIKETIKQAASAYKESSGQNMPGCGPVRAMAVSSLGEAVVPVSRDRRILGSSILMFDIRGEEYLDTLRDSFDPETFYRLNGNTIGNGFGLPKLMWLKEHRAQLYSETYKFLLWGSFVSFMLGCEPVVDYSLANRTLLFDLKREEWSEEAARAAEFDLTKLPMPVPSGTRIGELSASAAEELSLPSGMPIVSGAHDQCANALGCGVIEEGRAMYGMGTVICIVPVFSQIHEPQIMLAQGLNTEHHAVPGKYVSFIYNEGGSLFKWFRDNFAGADKTRAENEGKDIYEELISEMPEEPGSVMVLPHFSPTGPPHFISDSSGVIAGLKTETRRGEILKGLLQGATFYFRECIESLPRTGIEIKDFRVVGGGSKSDLWVQLSSDIMGMPFIRPAVTEAGSLGTAIMAGSGSGIFSSAEEGVKAMVRLEKSFEPDPVMHSRYGELYEKYTRLWPLMKDYLRGLSFQDGN